MLESVHNDKETNISENRKDRASFHEFIANNFSTVPQIICIGSRISPKISVFES